MSILEDGFAELAGAIRKRRVVDPELDEICQDYELLAIDLRKAIQREGESESAFLADIRSSLAGLRNEILDRLDPDRCRTG